MANQYKIPQKLDIEEKIIGPFTLKQFVFLLFGAVVVYILFNMFYTVTPAIFMITATPVAMITLSFVFIRINERPFEDFIFYFIGFLKNSRQLRWQKSTKLRTFERMTSSSADDVLKQKTIEKLAKRGIVKSRLTEIAKVLDTKGWSGEVGEAMMENRIISTSKAESAVKEKLVLGDEETLDDIFQDLEGAMEGLKGLARDEEIEKDLMGFNI